MNIAGKDWYPVYLNLAPEDIDELTKQAWDTLRVLVLDSSQELCIASGYGNTHSSMVECLAKHKKLRRVHTEDSIVYFDGKVAYINDSYSGHGDKIPARHWGKLYEPAHEDILRLLCEDRGLILT